MNNFKGKAKEMEHYLRLFRGSDLERFEKIDQKLDGIYQKIDSFEKRVTELELTSHLMRQLTKKHLKEPTRKGILNKFQDKTFNFFSTISVPGISRIFITDNRLFKALWTVLILISVTFGFYNISETVKDYYKFDVITNIERIRPDSVIFPAVTVCFTGPIKSDLFNGFRYVRTEWNHTVSIQHFLEDVYFQDQPISSSQLEFFEIPDRNLNCLRFNGARNKPLKTANSTLDAFAFTIKHLLAYRESVSENDEYNAIVSRLPPTDLRVFVGDNYADSFPKVLDQAPLGLTSQVFIKIPVIEKKLGEPHNNCRESTNESYHQRNCIETCIYREIKNKYNCTFNSLFAISDLKVCNGPVLNQSTTFKDEFYRGCEMECPNACESTGFSTEYFSRLTPLKTSFEFSVLDFASLHIKQIPKLNEFSIISNIGGCMGLFMGISFLSMVEVIEYIIDVISLPFLH